MSKLLTLLIAVVAVVVAFVLFVSGRQRVYVEATARRTFRGRFLLAVAFFLALFGGVVDRARGAEPPPAAAVTAQQPSLAEMKAAVEQIFRHPPAGTDWGDPAIEPNVPALLVTMGILPPPQGQITCYLRFAFPVKERSEELAALQKQLLDEKVAAGVIPEEVGNKITAIPDPKPDTPGEVRTFQKKVRRVARMLYRAGEIDSGMIKTLEAAIAMPIIDLDAAKALRADVTFTMQTCVRTRLLAPQARKAPEPQVRRPGEPPPEPPAPDRGLVIRTWLFRKGILAALAKQGVINEIKNHRREMSEGMGTDLVEPAKAEVTRMEGLLADPNHTVEFEQDEDSAVEMPAEIFAALRDPEKRKELTADDQPVETRLLVYRWRARRAIRILIAEGVVDEAYAKQFSTMIGIPVFGKTLVKLPEPKIEIDIESIKPMCYMPPPEPMRRGSRLSPGEQREMRQELRAAGAVSEDTLAKLDESDA